MSDLTALKASVSSNTTVIASAIALMTGLHDRLAEALVGDNLQADIDALTAELATNAHDLASAVAANTIADPTATSVGLVAEIPTNAPTDPAQAPTEAEAASNDLAAQA